MNFYCFIASDRDDQCILVDYNCKTHDVAVNLYITDLL